MSSKNNDNSWIPSSDIYNIVQMVDDVKARFIDDQSETTLAIGLFGVLGDIEAKKIQSAIQETYILGNEMFPTRAKLTKNLITHAAYHNITNINAKPASITLNLAIKVDDLDQYMKNTDSGDQEFIFSKDCPIYIGNYEFHLDYDIRLSRSFHNKFDSKGNKIYSYNARYIIDPLDPNPLSDIYNAYLMQPFKANFNNYQYIFMQPLARQCKVNTIEDNIITDSVIDNKSYTFNFEDQLADFVVYVTEDGVTRRLTPYMFGSMVEPDVTDYCWYMYTAEDTIRIQFDRTNYIPGFNSKIKIVVYTTSGASGNFSYSGSEDEAGFYIDYKSPLYGNKNIQCVVNCATDSQYGEDRKTNEELRRLLPKYALSRGYITTEKDLLNYFDRISDEKNRLTMQKKVDNQLRRIWYCYTLLKDNLNNVIPTNSINLNIDPLDTRYSIPIANNRYIIPMGTTFVLDKESNTGNYIAHSEIPEYYSDDYFNNGKFYYTLIHNMIINSDPLYCSYYNTIINRDDYFTFEYANDSVDVGFIVNKYHIARNLLKDQNKYTITFDVIQSTLDDLKLIESEVDNETGEVHIKTNNMKAYVVFVKNNEIYRWKEATLTSWDASEFTSSWTVSLETDNNFSRDNELNILGLGVPRSSKTNNGSFTDTMQAYVYILGRFTADKEDPAEGYGKSQITNIIPEELIDDDPDAYKFTLVNTYKTVNGMVFFENYTDVMNTKIRAIYKKDSNFDHFYIRSVPVVGCHYLVNEDYAIYLAQALAEKKAYIDDCLIILENNMQIDFKCYNTYGPSNTYTVASTTSIDKSKPLDRTDLTWQFRLKLTNSSDTKTKDNIIQYIKDYIENLNNASRDLHVPNLLHDIKEEYKDLIVYIEFKDVNNYGWGYNHLLVKEVEDPTTVPEFISVRNRLLSDGKTLEPCIDIELDRL